MPPSALTLKQRLANLANATSSPSTPHSLSSSHSFSSNASLSLSSAAGQGRSVSAPLSFQQTQTSRRKPLPFFNTPWSKNGGGRGAIAIDGVEETRRVEEVLPQMIFQAGVDYETRPMVILNASAFPNPHDVSYDLLLTRLLSYLDLFVESDYTVVFFAAGVQHAPSWNWVWKAYRSLSRKYRKNLKRLYIVHSSFFSKMLFSLAGAIISPKFFRKITYIGDLSSLAYHVPLTQIDIPPAVYQENLKHESQIQVPTPSRSHMFGVPLEELMGYDGEKDGLPRVVRDCVQYIREAGLEEQGLFRRSPNSAILRQVREAYNRGQPVSLPAFHDPHLAAVLLKKFLRDLPEPLFPEYLYAVIQQCPSPSDDSDAALEAVRYIRESLLPELPPCAYILLSGVLNLLHDVSLRSRSNLMDSRNLAIVITPSMVSSGNPLRDMQMYAVGGVPTLPSAMVANAARLGSYPVSAPPASPNVGAAATSLGTVIKLCIERYYEIFDEVRDRTEAVRPHHIGIDVPAVTTSGSPASLSPDAADGDRHFRIHDSDDDESAEGALNSASPQSSPRTTKKGLIERTTSPSRKAWNANAHQSAFSNSGVTQHRRGDSASLSVSASPSSLAARASVSSSSSSPTSGSKSRTRSLIAPNADSPSNENPRGTRRASFGPTSPITMRGRTSPTRTGVTSGTGTLRKAPGAGVTAVGVTANGFFAPLGGT